jgi:hypothetical protein
MGIPRQFVFLKSIKDVRTNATGKHVALLEGLLELIHADALLIHNVLRWSTREKS